MGSMRRRGSPAFLLILLVVPFVGIGLFMGGLVLHTLRRAEQMSKWMEVPVTILAADLERHRGDDSTTYKVTARYRYEVDGQAYEGTRVGLHSGSDNVGHWHEETYQTLAAARDGWPTLTCRVNPADPSDAILFPQVRIGMMLFYSLFGLVFGGVGLGVGWGLVRSARRRKQAEELPPDEVWKARPDWAEGRIRNTSRLEALVLTLVAVCWNSVCWPVLFVRGPELLREGGPALLFFLFPVVGLLVLAAAIRSHLIHRRYGRGIFQMAPPPGVLGGRLAGIIHLPEAARPPEGYEVTVKCLRTTRRGKHSHTETIWEAGRRINPDALPLSDQGHAIPVLFALPYELPPSEDWSGGGRINWRLELRGRQPGVDVVLTFDIPVFRTSASRPDFVLDEKPIQGFEMPG